MTGIGEEPVRPYCKGFYVGVAVFASLAGSMFTWGVFAPDGSPFAWRLVRTGVAIVFLFGAMQSFERLFRPARAQTVCKSAVAVCIIAFSIAGLLRLAGDQYERDFATDLQVLSAALFFAGFSVADFCGERFSGLLRNSEL